MLDPSLISGTPFRNATAYADLSGTVLFAFRAISERISQDLGVAVRLMPLGSPDITSDSFLFALQAQFADCCRALSIAPPADLQSFSLDDEAEYSSWTFLLSSELSRVKSAAGL